MTAACFHSPGLNVFWIIGECGGRGLRSADTEDGTICGLHAARGAALGFVLHGYAELPSTNDEAHRLAEAGAPYGTVVHATRQTAGRGRQRRTWLSPEGNLHAPLWIGLQPCPYLR